MAEEATIKIRRRWNFVGAIRKFTVFVDGNKIGTIKNGKEESFAISPGKHLMVVKGAVWSKTQAISLDLAPEQKKTFECGVTNSCQKQLVALFVLIVIEKVISGYFYAKLFFLLLLFCFGIFLLLVTLKPGKFYYLKDTSNLS
ncbi:MAG: hypothetical protein EXR74_07935 [Bdellovibrionales bacterium]|nr:hypothetical protein [Bdellovibrionales bacterium]